MFSSFLWPKAQGRSLAETSDFQATHLTITVDEIRSDKGKLMMALFNSKASFTRDAVVGKAVQIKNSKAVWKLSTLPPGKYAAAVFHDKNGNGKMDKSILGIPKEKYAFSRNARARFGPPSWEKASFTILEGANSETIHLEKE